MLIFLFSNSRHRRDLRILSLHSAVLITFLALILGTSDAFGKSLFGIIKPATPNLILDKVVIMGNSATKLSPLELTSKVETSKFMGTWFVIGNIPTYFETNASNAVETYTRIEKEKGHDIGIDFKYNEGEPITGKLKSLPQKGYIQGDNKEESSKWKVSPFWPVKIEYPIVEIDPDQYQYTVIGYPSRDYLWIMGRAPQMDDKIYNMLVERCEKKHGYDISKIRKVPQKWTKEERAKRGFEEEIADNMLESSDDTATT
jgi:apolipoprotein D and lipocalin family protein